MRRISAFRLSLAGIIALFMTHAAITITPASHDFGERAVNARSYTDATFRITVSRSH